MGGTSVGVGIVNIKYQELKGVTDKESAREHGCKTADHHGLGYRHMWSR